MESVESVASVSSVSSVSVASVISVESMKSVASVSSVESLKSIESVDAVESLSSTSVASIATSTGVISPLDSSLSLTNHEISTTTSNDISSPLLSSLETAFEYSKTDIDSSKLSSSMRSFTIDADSHSRTHSNSNGSISFIGSPTTVDSSMGLSTTSSSIIRSSLFSVSTLLSIATSSETSWNKDSTLYSTSETSISSVSVSTEMSSGSYSESKQSTAETYIHTSSLIGESPTKSSNSNTNLANLLPTGTLSHDILFSSYSSTSDFLTITYTSSLSFISSASSFSTEVSKFLPSSRSSISQTFDPNSDASILSEQSSRSLNGNPRPGRSSSSISTTLNTSVNFSTHHSNMETITSKLISSSTQTNVYVSAASKTTDESVNTKLPLNSSNNIKSSPTGNHNTPIATGSFSPIHSNDATLSGLSTSHQISTDDAISVHASQSLNMDTFTNSQHNSKTTDSSFSLAVSQSSNTRSMVPSMSHFRSTSRVTDDMSNSLDGQDRETYHTTRASEQMDISSSIASPLHSFGDISSDADIDFGVLVSTRTEEIPSSTKSSSLSSTMVTSTYIDSAISSIPEISAFGSSTYSSPATSSDDKIYASEDSEERTKTTSVISERHTRISSLESFENTNTIRSFTSSVLEEATAQETTQTSSVYEPILTNDSAITGDTYISSDWKTGSSTVKQTSIITSVPSATIKTQSDITATSKHDFITTVKVFSTTSSPSVYPSISSSHDIQSGTKKATVNINTPSSELDRTSVTGNMGIDADYRNPDKYVTSSTIQDMGEITHSSSSTELISRSSKVVSIIPSGDIVIDSSETDRDTLQNDVDSNESEFINNQSPESNTSGGSSINQNYYGKSENSAQSETTGIHTGHTTTLVGGHQPKSSKSSNDSKTSSIPDQTVNTIASDLSHNSATTGGTPMDISYSNFATKMAQRSTLHLFSRLFFIHLVLHILI
ncbi:hypothetical protein DAKH74_051280 [Maudiozyma humilis]|uniref:Uncharacterized protein n=1 Tax=Maudiozyma humilis TaxID=51915 RepID=A0AAV5S676_MAUHU|nr:hypothetical protein DAKH74_051280 [Kazachstania humilis]